MKSIEQHNLDRSLRRAAKTLKRAKAMLRKCRISEELRNHSEDIVWDKLKTPPPVPVTQYQRDTADEILQRALKGMDKDEKG